MKKSVFVGLLMLLIILLMPMILTSKADNLLKETISTEPTTTTGPTTEELIDPNEWFVTDTQPIFIPEETYPTETTKPTKPTEPPVEPSVEEIIWYSEYRPNITNEITVVVAGEIVNIEFLAKLVLAEAGISSWEGQVFTCSAILNMCDYYNISLWEAGHDINYFAVAEWVDEMEPTDETYELVCYVLNGGRIADICYFRTKYYHSFGTPVCQIDNQFFSKP